MDGGLVCLRVFLPSPLMRVVMPPCLINVDPRMKSLRLIIVLVISLVLFCITFANSLSVTTNGERTTAACVDVDRPASRAGRRQSWRFTKYKFRYTAQDGQVHSPTIRFGAFWLKPKVGESVPIIYSKESPDSIYHDSIFHVWMLPAVFGGVLIVFVVKRVIWRRPNIE